MTTWDIHTLETELKRRVSEYPVTPWGQKQTNQWDNHTDFIYKTPSWEALQRKIKPMAEPLQNYAINRWFNFWSAMGVEAIFCDLPGVVAAKAKDRLVDFTIQGIKFDHKTSVFPAGYEPGFLAALAQPERLTEWLYNNQSKEKRFHLGNRLFVILYDGKGDHWKLRAELSLIRQQVEQYVRGFSPKGLIRLNGPGGEILTDVIWVTR